jgi:hypothetical protein
MTVNLSAFTSNPPQIYHRKTTFCTSFLPKPPAKTPVIPPRKKITAKAFPLQVGSGFSGGDDDGGCSLNGGEAQGVVIFFEGEAEGFDDEVVVVPLCQAGYGGRADDACAGHVDGEAAAMRGVVGVGQAVAFGEGTVGVLEREADGVGTAVEAGDDVGFALHPSGVVRCTAERGVEERLVGLAEAADVDDDGLFAGEGEFAKAEAETPGGVVVEAGKEEFGFLAGDGG